MPLIVEWHLYFWFRHLRPRRGLPSSQITLLPQSDPARRLILAALHGRCSRAEWRQSRTGFYQNGNRPLSRSELALNCIAPGATLAHQQQTNPFQQFHGGQFTFWQPAISEMFFGTGGD